ncbi:hypothetical protein ACIRBZ_40130 [Streptomyces sp. NPDC094038]|uniref:hypothetical protein n=1 Tax=Streptomyces sp. NPDC094038 TaxID=3366055 RepID=UPI003813460E
MFFFGLAADDQARAVLAERAEQAGAHHEQLAELRTELDSDEGPLTANGRIALEYGLRWAEMERDWARWAAEQLG